MKICFIIFLPLCLMIGVTHAQEKRINPKISIAQIITMNNEPVKGILYAINDSSVTLYIENTAVNKNMLQQDSLPLRIYSYREIDKIKVRKRSAVAEGALVGGVTGLVEGLALDALNQTVQNLYRVDPWGGGGELVSFSPVFTITLSLIGTGVGAIIGSSKKKFEINGNEENFRASEYELMKRSLRKISELNS